MSHVRAWAPIVCTLVTTACGGSIPHPRYVGQPTSALVEVPYPPPAARPEGIPPRPSESAVWIDGEWRWRRSRWSWKSGRWVAPPPGAAFSPWTSVRRTDGVVFFAPGVWRDARGQALDDPAPLATAVATAAAL